MHPTVKWERRTGASVPVGCPDCGEERPIPIKYVRRGLKLGPFNGRCQRDHLNFALRDIHTGTPHPSVDWGGVRVVSDDSEPGRFRSKVLSPAPIVPRCECCAFRT